MRMSDAHEAETSQKLEWADLITLDLSLLDSPPGKEKLVLQLKHAVQSVGFFYVTNFGIHQDEIDAQFEIAKEVFQLPTDIKMNHCMDLERGGDSGYRPKGVVETLPGLKDNYEMYNIFKFIPGLERSHPEPINLHRPAIELFQRKAIESVAGRLFTLIALALELPETFLASRHCYDNKSDCHLRYLLYHHRSKAENERYNQIYSGGHTDFGSLTLLFRQPVAGLQIRTPDGFWKWVKPQRDAITVNIADVLQFWTAGYMKSSIHRVVSPPSDQAHIDRLGIMVFLRPPYDLKLKALESPWLKRIGAAPEDVAACDITAGDWIRARIQRGQDKRSETQNGDREVLHGLKALYSA